MRQREHQLGFSAIEAMLVVLVVAVLAVSGFVVYQHHKDTSIQTGTLQTTTKPKRTTTAPPSNTTTAQPTQSDPYQGWSTYSSSDGNFTFKYPADWYVAGPGTGPSAGEINLEPQSSQSSTVNAFRMTLWIVTDQDYSAQPSSITDGTVQQLANGINLWQESEASTSANGTNGMVCPTLQITNQSQTHFSYQLKNGEYLNVHGSYCEGQKDTSSLTYQQQLTSQPWEDATKIIASINFH